MCVCLCVCACVHACVRACMRVCVCVKSRIMLHKVITSDIQLNSIQNELKKICNAIKKAHLGIAWIKVFKVRCWCDNVVT